MAGKLKTFTTTSGFFDLAVAAPSMKAALDLWGAGFNLFTHGFARQSDDRSTVAATLAKPGVVLRRPVGTDQVYSEHAEASLSLPHRKAKASPPEPRAKAAKPVKPAKPTDKQADNKVDKKAGRAAALAYAREQKRRDQRSRKEEAARHKEGERRDRAIAAAQAELEEAEAAHTRTVQEIEKAQSRLDSKAAAEDARWKTERERLEDALRRARVPRHLKVV
jgi:colicin import membrane protein